MNGLQGFCRANERSLSELHSDLRFSVKLKVEDAKPEREYAAATGLESVTPTM